MPLYYDEALPALIRTACAAGVDICRDDVVVLRDAAGRLGIVFGCVPDGGAAAAYLADRLQDALGAYALSEVVLPSGLFPIISAAGPRFVTLPVDGALRSVNLVDRRVVGQDWTREFVPPSAGPPRLVFGSLKGGVGRTTALTVLAADLARTGDKVLCVDLDLEAPGLGSMLLHEVPDDRRPRYGALDYLVENGIGGIDEEELSDFIGVSRFGEGLIHVLPAVGRETDGAPANMIGKLARGLTEDMTSAGQVPVARQMREMVDRFVARDTYTAVLVDSRAGLAEATGAAWLGLGARKLILFGIDQPQTFHGYRYLFSHLIQTFPPPETQTDRECDEAEVEAADWRTRLSFVQAKAPNLGSRREPFREKLHELCSETLYDVDEGPEAPTGVNFAFDARGPDVPHDATHIADHPTYQAYDPLAERAVLDPEVYRGPFGAFLERARTLLGLEQRP